MIRIFSLVGMFGGFLVISPPFRGSTLNLLSQGMFYMDQYSPYTYVALAISVGLGAVWSLAAPKPQ